MFGDVNNGIGVKQSKKQVITTDGETLLELCEATSLVTVNGNYFKICK